MSYGVKWIIDNLGITRDAIIYYEENGLISQSQFRSSHGEREYREYDDDGIARLWWIKTLQSIGYTAKEIKALQDSEDENALKKTIPSKILALTAKKEKLEGCLALANAISFSGLVPMPTKLGNMKFDEFETKVKTEWSSIFSLGSDPEQFTEIQDKMNNKMMDFLANMSETTFMSILPITIYFKVLTALKRFDYRDEHIQSIVSLIYDACMQVEDFSDLPEEKRREAFARLYGSIVMDGEVFSQLDNEGIDREYVGKAILYFGGYELEERKSNE